MTVAVRMWASTSYTPQCTLKKCTLPAQTLNFLRKCCSARSLDKSGCLFMYTFFRVVSLLGRPRANPNFNVEALLMWFARRGADGSKSQMWLCHSCAPFDLQGVP
ncbi:unnamed protein product [Polarella glacialis]|uniref:Uncharacterized protein n=1 Tax=Polarella glacialis TaxID=89957 RepID=A0A813KV32_POLGL|nr:unnamed protein product [Polarella glacialis]